VSLNPTRLAGQSNSDVRWVAPARPSVVRTRRCCCRSARQACQEPLPGVRQDLPVSRCLRGGKYEWGEVRPSFCPDLMPVGLAERLNAGQPATRRSANAGGWLEGFYGRSEELRCPKAPDCVIGELADSRPKAFGKLSDSFLFPPLPSPSRSWRGSLWISRMFPAPFRRSVPIRVRLVASGSYWIAIRLPSGSFLLTFRSHSGVYPYRNMFRGPLGCPSSASHRQKAA
jgi:hypothetical protein